METGVMQMHYLPFVCDWTARNGMRASRHFVTECHVDMSVAVTQSRI